MGRGLPLVLLLCAGCASATPPKPPVFGLPPIYPGARPFPETVDSLQPTLRWEPFPRPADRAADTDGWLERIRYVTYDLRIWRAANALLDYPADLVYARTAWPDTAHTVQAPLAPGTMYLWSVRARFELDGQTRVTEWSTLAPLLPGSPAVDQSDPPRSPLIPPAGYYRFRTP